MTHGGNIYNKKIEYDFSINLNPLGMPEAIVRALVENVTGFSNYPDPNCSQLKAKLCSKIGSILEENIIFGNGAAELIYQIVQAMSPKKALIISPTFSEYEKALKSTGCSCEFFELSEALNFKLDVDSFASRITDDIDIVVLCNPNNPTGQLLDPNKIRIIADTCLRQGVYLLLDECFIELCNLRCVSADNGSQYNFGCRDDDNPLSIINNTDFTNNSKRNVANDLINDSHQTSIYLYPNVVTLRAFTKTYAMAGLRLGYCIINEPTLIKKINQSRQPWSISVPAQIAGITAIEKCDDYLNEAKNIIARQRLYLSTSLTSLGFRVYPSDANYLLFYSQDLQLYDKLLARGILIRNCSNFRGLKAGYYRICVGNEAQNKILVENIKAVSKL